ncbi:MAG: baseplate protein [Planctomycetota bacterium]|nr:MAG: baseplate protein [Planctomycetota bacterium]
MAAGKKKPFLGVGWKFPIDVDRRRGVAMSQAEDSIYESILIILGTALGERVMRPDFGCQIHDLIFAPNNANTHGLIRAYVEEAIRRWEPRVQDVTVETETDPYEETKVTVKVQYRVISTNNVFNMVYPFYLQKESQ